MMAKALHLGTGYYSHHVFSLHLYEKDLENALKAVGHTLYEPAYVGAPSFTIDSVPTFWSYARSMNILTQLLIDDPDTSAWNVANKIGDDLGYALAHWKLRKQIEDPAFDDSPYCNWVNAWLSKKGYFDP
jgi:hypothetical protein